MNEPFSVCESGRVKKVELSHDRETRQTLTLTIHSLDGNRIHDIRFVNVTSLRFLEESVHLGSHIVLLMAQDVASHQWEDVRYRIRDIEEEFLTFDCASFEHV